MKLAFSHVEVAGCQDFWPDWIMPELPFGGATDIPSHLWHTFRRS
jgi:hypothetical protein